MLFLFQIYSCCNAHLIKLFVNLRNRSIKLLLLLLLLLFDLIKLLLSQTWSGENYQMTTIDSTETENSLQPNLTASYQSKSLKTRT